MNPSRASQAKLRSIQDLMQSGQPEKALKRCVKLSRAFPRDIELLGLYSSIQTHLGLYAQAQSTLERVIGMAPNFSRAHEDMGLLYLALGKPEAALFSLEKALSLSPEDGRTRLGYARALLALRKFDEVIAQVNIILAKAPQLLEAHYLMGKASRATGDLNAARHAFAIVLTKKPGHARSLVELGETLESLDELPDAIEAYRKYLALEPADSAAALRLATVLAALGKSSEAASSYQQVLQKDPTNIAALLGVGHMEKSLGNRTAALKAYDTAMSAHPNNGAVYQSLANLKNYTLSNESIAHMEALLEGTNDVGPSEVSMLFALGKAWDDRQEYDKAWTCYSWGNSARRLEHPYQAEKIRMMTDRIVATFTRDFFAGRAESSAAEKTPIFVVGMPRSGSTLVEQILASHSLIEGTRELPFIPRICQGLRSAAYEDIHYPEVLAKLEDDDVKKLSSAYLLSSAPHRAEGLRYFIDKMPANFMHIALIHLMFPKARIIDVQRAPLDVCVANLRHHFSRGQEFAYAMEDVAHYYNQYRRLMNHWDQVLPGRVINVCYEDLVTAGEEKIYRLLDQLRVPREKSCLEFYDQRRAVHTASSEQVRQPIYTSAVNYWEHYESHLRPLKAALALAD